MSNIWEDLAAPFAEDELEWKPQTIGRDKNKQPYAVVVPYVSSRAIMDRLDKIMTPAGWQSELRPTCIKGEEGFICRLSLWLMNPGDIGAMGWVPREDVAPASDIEPMKGAASGALKRVAVHFGIGRYLYALPQYRVWSQDIHDGYPPKDVPDAILLKSKEHDILAWCHAPKIGPQKAQEGSKNARPAKSTAKAAPDSPEPDVPDYSDIPLGEPPAEIDETPSRSKAVESKPVWKGIGTENGETGTFVRSMKSRFGKSTCAFCGEVHIKEGDEIVGITGIPGTKKDQWGDRTCYANWCAQVGEASHAA